MTDEQNDRPDFVVTAAPLLDRLEYDYPQGTQDFGPLLREAAAEIERLRGLVEHYRTDAEIERLRLEVHLHDGRIEALEEAAKMDCGSPVPSDLTCIGMRRETRWTCAPCFARRVLGRTYD